MDIEGIFQSAQEAFWVYKNCTSVQKSHFLNTIAEGLDSKREEIISIASQESNLPLPRITGELGRTIGQIKLFASLLEEGSWVEAVIDQADPQRSPVPKPDIRRMLIPIGPVVVFGASNFPLAFSTAGGDTISALAAGCPVIYKAHFAHPKTSQLVAEVIQKAVLISGLPKGVFSHVEGGIDIGQRLVQHDVCKAVAFTGSFTGGKAIFDTVNQRKIPIPVYAEMGSVNPIVALEQKITSNTEDLAKQFVASLTLGVGQFCTNPGLVMVPSKVEKSFSAFIKESIQEVAASPMLHEGIAASYYKALTLLQSKKELEWVHVHQSQDLIKGYPALAKIKAVDWIKDELFQQEVFGSFAIMVIYEDEKELKAIAKNLHGQLTITLWAEEKELEQHAELINILKEKCGRLLFKGVPTGVEVGHAMQHGGPFPSTTDVRSTSVGSYAIKRFARPIAFQDMPDGLLPEALKNKNVLGIWRSVDGVFTSNSI
jgi:acyl-CoA reductase-like NAD-dependent aldehyde dehydrogenase